MQFGRQGWKNGALRGAIHTMAGLILTASNFAVWAGGAPQTHLVEIKGGKFLPEAITIAVGDKVRWINRDYIPHTATAQGADEHAAWGTGHLNREESGEVVFSQSGRMQYLCMYHPVMTGEIIVTE